MAKRKGLGRGLDALLGGLPAEGMDEAKDPTALRQLPVESIERGRYQPRTFIDEEALDALAASIREQGLLQPVVVRPLARGRFELIAGERRWRASQRAGLSTVPAVVHEVDDQSALAMALIENIQREDLNALEEARALDRLIREFELTHAAAAQAIGRSRAAVSNLLRLLDLNEEVRALVESGALEMGHARALLAVSGARQGALAREVVTRGLSVRETEALVRREGATAEPSRTRASPVREDPDVRRLLADIGESLGARVELKSRRGGKGALVIHYSSLDELDGIIARINPPPR